MLTGSAKRVAGDMRETSLFKDRTGLGRASIYSEKAKKEAAGVGLRLVWRAEFGARKFYMLFLEGGTQRLRALHFSQLAINTEQPVFERRVQKAYNDALNKSRVAA